MIRYQVEKFIREKGKPDCTVRETIRRREVRFVEKKTAKQGMLSGSMLKLIACLSMLIDHIGAAVVYPLIFESRYFEFHRSFAGFSSEELLEIYQWMRRIGRLAFPIYCFLLAEGYFHTKSPKKMAFRLFLFALVSEIPFDLAFQRIWFYPGHQNVFFTLGLGFLAVWGHDHFKKKSPESPKGLLALLAAMGAAHLLHTDYSWFGVGLIFIFYFWRERPLQCSLAAFFACLWQAAALLALIPIRLYNGKRGSRIKYAFYLFYPLHLTLLYGVFLRLSK